MATRTPSLQARSGFHHYWGQYATAAALPNATGNPIGAPYFAELEVGDVAYVTGLTELYQCTSVGTSGLGDALWTSAGAGHQTVRFIVGNALSGDTIHTCDFLDPGNGTGLQAALLAAAALGFAVDIFVRAGTITLNPALVALPLVLPSSCTLRGAGQHATTIVCGNGAGATPLESFQFATKSTVHDIGFTVPAYDAAAVGGFDIFGIATFVTVRDVYVFVTTSTVNPGVFAIFDAYLGANVEGILFERVYIDAPSLGAGYPTGLYGFSLDGGTPFGDPYPEASVPARFLDCTVHAPGQLFFSVYSSFPEIEVDGFMSHGAGGIVVSWGGFAAIAAKAYKGPKISRVTQDSQGIAALQPASTAYAFYFSCTQDYLAGATVVGTEIDRVSILGDTNVPAPDLVVVTTRTPLIGGSVSDCHAYSTDAAVVPRLGLFSDHAGVLTSFAVEGCTVYRGLLVVSSSVGSTTSDNRIVGCDAATVQITAGCTNNFVVSSRITTALTDAGTGTQIGLNIVGP